MLDPKTPIDPALVEMAAERGWSEEMLRQWIADAPRRRAEEARQHAARTALRPANNPMKPDYVSPLHRPTPARSVDYRHLLVKFAAHLLVVEGSHFLDDYDFILTRDTFTETEMRALGEIRSEVEERRRAR